MNSIKINLYNLSQRTANLGLIILFPGFFLYHYALAAKWSPAFAGGLFGPVSLFLAAMFIMLLPWIIQIYLRGAMMPVLLFLLTISYMSTISFLYFCLEMDQIYMVNSFESTAATLIRWIACFYVSSFISFRNSYLKEALIISLIPICLLIVITAVNSDSLMNGFRALLAGDGENENASYQGMARSVLILQVFLISIVSKARYRKALFIIGIILLLFIGARTEFVALLFLWAAFLFLPSEKQAKVFLKGLAVLIFVVLLYHTFGEYVPETRINQLLNLSESTSWQAREEGTRIAIRTISQSIILGDYGYHLRDDVGYAHNALSAWANYGLLGFSLYIGLIGYCTWIPIRELFFRRNMAPEWMVAFSLNLTSCVLVMGALYVSSEYPALGWGATINALLQKHKRTFDCKPRF
jgi:hypothetical protein